MSVQISELNGVKIYNYSSGKSLPQFLEDAYKKHKSLRYDEEYRNRIEVIQGFEFNSSCNQVQITKDQSHIMATGIYAPQLKIYETHNLAEKCLRGLDSEVVKFCMISDDYSKIAMAQQDRNIELHAQYGRHYRTRIPRYPRDIVYQPFTCDLLVTASGSDIYRISLDEGQFLAPFESLSKGGVNCIDYNEFLNISATGGEEGIFEIWDYRLRQRAISKIMNNGFDITAIKHDSSGLQYGVGSSNGLVRVYDIRYDSHILEVKHHYKSPINTIEFHEPTKNILSSSSKILKINSKIDGKIFTNIEPKNQINMFNLVPDSGMILMAEENPRIGVYFIPELDKAPKWVPFLENLTEELEEKQNQVVYDEYKFVSLEDLEKLEATNLIGTKMIKSHLHGYLIHMKLYQKLKFKNDPFSFQDYQKKKTQEELQNIMGSRVKKSNAKEDKAKVNREYMQELLEKQEKSKGFKADNIINDPRFGKMFQDDAFAIDKNDVNYKLKHTSTTNRRKNSDDQDYYDEEQFMAEETEKQNKQNSENKNDSILQHKAIQKKKKAKIALDSKKTSSFEQRKISSVQNNKKKFINKKRQ